MLVLGIDTSSDVVVSSLFDGIGVVATSTQPGTQAHGELLAPGIEETLRDGGCGPGDLTHVVVGVGPGPFTGLRVGVVTALVMAEALGVPVLGVCSLDVVALAGAGHDGLVTGFSVITDARRKEVYVARYDADGRRLAAPIVARPGDLDSELRSAPVVGAGAELYADLFTDVRSTAALDATALAAVSGAIARGSEQFEALAPRPLYLRRPDAVENARRKRVTPS
jgi:tRNA threonylcarbamoyl adenosine modification protein YeaZ